MTFDPNPPRGGMATMLTPSQPEAPPVAPSTMGRWIGGPLFAALVGALTLWIAGLINSRTSPPKNRGQIQLATDPAGATVIVDGKVHVQPTPTTLTGEIGSTLRVVFKLDGYVENEADVVISEGQRSFRAKLERREVPPPPEPPPEPAPPPEPHSLAPPAPPVVKDERPHPKKEPKKDPRRERPPAPTPTIAPAMTGTGTLSVHVRPWAIVYVDGAKVHQTPLDGHTLTAGLHVVELVNDGLDKKEKVTVEVRANANEVIRRDWEK